MHVIYIVSGKTLGIIRKVMKYLRSFYYFDNVTNKWIRGYSYIPRLKPLQPYSWLTKYLMNQILTEQLTNYHPNTK